MDTVVVELRTLPASPVGPNLMALQPGESASFGRCGCGRCGTDIVLAGPGVPRQAGTITAGENHWRLTNSSRGSSYVVEHLEDSGQYITVEPGRARTPIPFELSRIVVPGSAAGVDLIVFVGNDEAGPDCLPGLADATDCACEPTAESFSLDPTAKYFLVLVALCEPRLRSDAAAHVPTAREIVDRLKALPSCSGLSESAVHFHIDYLVSEKLRLELLGAGQPGRIGWKRLALATMAMRHGLVRSEHLLLLPARGRRPLP